MHNKYIQPAVGPVKLAGQYISKCTNIHEVPLGTNELYNAYKLIYHNHQLN